MDANTPSYYSGSGMIPCKDKRAKGGTIMGDLIEARGRVIRGLELGIAVYYQGCPGKYLTGKEVLSRSYRVLGNRPGWFTLAWSSCFGSPVRIFGRVPTWGILTRGN